MLHKIPFKQALILLIGLILLCIGFISMTLVRSYGVPFVNILFELIIFILLLFALKKIHPSLLMFSGISLLYIVYSYVTYVLNSEQGKISDFFVVYKVFFYIVILSFISNNKLIEPYNVSRFYKTLILIFFVKYSLTLIVGFSDRPAVYYENNFELMLFLLLMVGLKSTNAKLSKKWIFVLFLLIIMSGSRASALSFLVAVPFLDLFKRRLHLYVFLSISITAVGYLFLSRLGGSMDLEKIDRIQFFLYFLSDIYHWGLWEYLVGNPPMTPVSDETAFGLSFYSQLYSDHENLLAYSVLFHSYMMRVVFDHGIIGAFFIFHFIFKLLKLNGYNNSECYAVLGILIANGLSVSSLNNVFAIFSIAILISFRRNKLLI